MSKINQLVQDVMKESAGTLVRSQRLAIANAVAKAFAMGEAVGANMDMLDEVQALKKGDDSFIE
jgi:hypothetical protein